MSNKARSTKAKQKTMENPVQEKKIKRPTTTHPSTGRLARQLQFDDLRLEHGIDSIVQRRLDGLGNVGILRVGDL